MAATVERSLVRRLVALLLVAAILAPWLVPRGTTSRAASAAPRLHPELAATLATGSDGPVAVIVRARTGSGAAGVAVESAGGEIKHELPMLDAVAATVPAAALGRLAASREIAWIAPDAPVTLGQSETVRLFLHSDPIDSARATRSRPVLPISTQAPRAESMQNLDSDRNDAPGLTLLRGGTGPDEANPARIQRWRTQPAQQPQPLAGRIELKYFAAPAGLVPAKLRVNAYLLAISPSGRSLIASGSDEIVDRQGQWQRRTILFPATDHVVQPDHALELVLVVGQESTRDAWIAFGNHRTASHLLIERAGTPRSAANETIGAPQLWRAGHTGDRVSVAVIDSGIDAGVADFSGGTVTGRVIAEVDRNSRDPEGHVADENGHGTYMAGIVAGNGRGSNGRWRGVAPGARLINLRVADAESAATESDIVAAMQWVLDHKDQYHIRVVNLSLNSSSRASYHQSPLDAAAEILWFNGIVVVVAGGNNGQSEPGVIYPPANDPFVIAVGATDTLGTATRSDDELAAFSASGLTEERVARPDLVAPGSSVIAPLPRHGSTLARLYPENVIWTTGSDGVARPSHLTASGTSVSAAVVSGAAALLLDAIPQLNPDQVKYLLTASAGPIPDMSGAGAGSVDVAAALAMARRYDRVTAIPAANTGTHASQLLWTGNEPVSWGSVSWGSVGWGSVNWGSVNWGSVNWGSVGWGSIAPEY